MWKPSTTSGVGYRVHLYTRVVAGQESDDIETWLDREFERPAAEPLEKAISGCKLTPNDWKYLIRFVAAQIVRTPAYFIDNRRRWEADVPKLLGETLRQSVEKWEAATRAGIRLVAEKAPNSEYLPLHISVEKNSGSPGGTVKTTVLLNRDTWFFSMKHLLTVGAGRQLHDYRWTIVSPCEGASWFTSDDPVIRLNFYVNGAYDFKGGVGMPGAEILLPLSPTHLLYAQVGHKPPPRGTIMSPQHTAMIRRFIAEHAHRMIFAASPEQDIVDLRPRTVDEQRFREEEQMWQDWHAEQSAAERGLAERGQKA